MKRTWRRRNYFIKKDLQGKYIFSFFIFVIFGSILFTLIFSFLSFNTLTIVYKNYNLQIGKTPLILLKEILGAHWIFIITAGLAVVIVSMFLTHRFAGPMYRFEKSIEEMLRGNFNFEIRLRRKDEGKELAHKMNQLIAMLSSSFKEMRTISENIQNELNNAKALIEGAGANEETLSGLQNTHLLNRRLRELLDSFKTKN